jgi:5,10-methenyltetrahydrofolate synthetase
MDTLSHERSLMRKLMIARRDLLSTAEQLAKSERIAASLLAHSVFQQKKIICVYCHIQSEVQTALVINNSLKQGKTVCVPFCAPQEAGMTMVAITDPVRDLAPGYKGIPEPLPHLILTGKTDPLAIEVVVIPGTVFDRNGHRLGYGKGFYDRFLVRAPQAVRIGLAFSCQVVEHLPAQEHDVPMDILFTEEEILVWPERWYTLDRGMRVQ